MRSNPKLQTLNPKLQTPNFKLQTLNPKSQTLNLRKAEAANGYTEERNATQRLLNRITNAGSQKLKPELNIANWFETRGAFYHLHDHCN